jgi:4-hydroxy-3-methylbut-2-enyl diphosphate reductase
VPRIKGTVLLAQPSGFCAGVVRAIDVVERALERYGAPVYVRGEIIHSGQVVEELRGKGAIFVATEDEVPEGEICVFSAHGVSPDVRRNAEERELKVVDATCPLVNKVHVEARRYARAGREIVMIGRRGHEEVEGTLGEAPDHIHVVATTEEIDALEIPGDAPVAYIMQTTLAVDDTAELVDYLKGRFTDLIGPSRDDICYASQNRQAAVKAIAPDCDLVLIAGARNSSNSNRLVEVARACGVDSYLVPEVDVLDPRWLEDVGVVGLGAGASAPPQLIDAILERLGNSGYDRVEVRETVTENVTFPAAKLPA